MIELCIDQLYKLEQPHIQKQNFAKFLIITTYNVRFYFDNEMQIQHEIIAIRFTIGNIFNGFLESKIISKKRNTIFQICG